MKRLPENNVISYIASAPEEMRPRLKELRAIIKKAAPKATERTDYFHMPGYSYDNLTYYNGMFVWFSFKKPYVRLHVLPAALEKYSAQTKQFQLTKSIIGFRVTEKIPKALITKLVKESARLIKALSATKK